MISQHRIEGACMASSCSGRACWWPGALTLARTLAMHIGVKERILAAFFDELVQSLVLLHGRGRTVRAFGWRLLAVLANLFFFRIGFVIIPLQSRSRFPLCLRNFGRHTAMVIVAVGHIGAGGHSSGA
jgi:hypothetical protein